ncbi:Pro-resilin-like 11 [Homarus americanus]|uniref:Pro-resilin-like 11 n=1 Tax=Homarus americanus TaxID=6706 RepID=A0A8J5MWJ5_HOMAM|nr:Pro-resilin-like 11 [Homarus americanus]
MNVLLLLALVAVAAADKRPATGYGAPPVSSEESEPPKYGFDWAVQDGESGNDFGQQEARDNDNTKGSYTVQLPDGRLQTVTYYVEGDSGYVVDVKYDGEAQYPDSDEVRSYAPPRPLMAPPKLVETPVWPPPGGYLDPPTTTRIYSHILIQVKDHPLILLHIGITEPPGVLGGRMDEWLMNSEINVVQALLLLALVAVAAADKRPATGYGAPPVSSEESEPPKYGFDWAIQDGESGNDFGQQETRDNDHTKGSYTVQLPDGRLQTVTYYVEGDSGYVVDVKYDGEAQYPDSDEVRRIYSHILIQVKDHPLILLHIGITEPPGVLGGGMDEWLMNSEINVVQALLLLALVAVAAADKRPATGYGAPPVSSEESEPPKYGFDWAVQDGESGNDFGQQEARDNDNTKGSYTVQLPDGRLQTVTYYVDGDSGYVVDVKYDGEAQYPDSDEVRRIYSHILIQVKDHPLILLHIGITEPPGVLGGGMDEWLMNSEINVVQALLLLALVAVAAADKRPATGYGAPPVSSEESEPPKYGFDWAIQDGESGNDFGQQETRDNDHTKGSYTVQLPDGRLQTVTYYVDGDSGYVVDVKYDGEAQYPDSDEVRSYAPPRPTYGAP